MAVSHGSSALHAEGPQGRDGEGAGAGSDRQSHSMIRAVVCSRFQCLSNGSRSEKDIDCTFRITFCVLD